MTTARGFSLIEVLVAMAVMTTGAGVLLSLIMAGQSIARLQPEAADLQQRARIATQTFAAELAAAGAGLDAGPRAGPLSRRFPAVTASADGGLTLWSVTASSAQATLSAPLAPDAIVATIATGACPVPCGFEDGSTALLFDDGGCHDAARVDVVAGDVLTLRPAARMCAYAAGAAIAQGQVRTYRVDPASRQLLRRDEATGTSVPVVDHVAAMSIELLESGRRIRVVLRFTPAVLLQVPALVVTIDSRPANLQES